MNITLNYKPIVFLAPPPLLTTPLVSKDIFYSSSIGDLAAVKLLIEGNEQKQIKKANVDAVDASGNTALHWAAYRNHAPVVEYLLANGANPEMTNKEDGQTPLHWACVAGNAACVHLLLKQGMPSDDNDISFHT